MSDGRDRAAGGRPPLRGLTVSLHRLRLRHAYRVTERTGDSGVRELGALRAEPGEGRIPVWLDDGRLVCESMTSAPPRPSRKRVMRWIVEPLAAKRTTSPGVESAWRAASRLGAAALRPWRRAVGIASTVDAPAGYLHASPEPGTLPLFSAVHPVTGDQLLTTEPAEAAERDYGSPLLLGHLVAAAPATDVLVSRPGFAPVWAGPGGLRGRARPLAAGAITQPSDDSQAVGAVFRLAGWAMLPGEGVARVDCFVNGRMAGRARLGLPRNLPQRLWPSPEAAVSGFDFWVGGSALEPGPGGVEVEALVTGVRGSEFLAATRVSVAPEAPGPGPAASERRGRRAAPPGQEGRRGRGRAEGLRLLAFTHRLDAGGAQRYLCEQVGRLAESGDVSAVVISPEDGEWRGYLEAAGVEVRLTSGYPTGTVDVYEQGMSELSALVADESFDVALVNTLVSFPGADLADRLGVPIVWAVHESYEVPLWWAMVSDHAHPYPQARLEHVLGRAGALLFAADATRALYRSYAAEERMLLAPYGLEIDHVDDFRRDCDPAALRPELGVPEDAVIVLCLSVVDPRKGQVPLARAFAEVAARHPKAHLLLVGDRDSPYGRALHRYVESTHIADRCTMVPLTMDAYRWHAVADVFALASNVESSPIAILEAMAFETPVVAPNIFGIPELITDGRDGYLFEESDVADLARALDRVLGADPAERRAVGRAGSTRVRERHDPARYAANLGHLLRDLADRPSASPAWDESRRTALTR